LKYLPFYGVNVLAPNGTDLLFCCMTAIFKFGSEPVNVYNSEREKRERERWERERERDGRGEESAQNNTREPLTLPITARTKD
jgi:hypothetical protein